MQGNRPVRLIPLISPLYIFYIVFIQILTLIIYIENTEVPTVYVKKSVYVNIYIHIFYLMY